MPLDLAFHGAVTAPDGRVFVVGGDHQTASIYAEPRVEALTLGASPSWSAVEPMATGRNSHAVALGADGRIYAIAGETSNAPVTDVKTVEAYTPATNHWAAVAPALIGRARLAAAMAADGRVYALGGSVAGMAELKTVEAYGPVFTVDATSAAAGAKVHVTAGSNFATNATVTFSLVQGGNSTILGSSTSDGSGVLAAPVELTVPAVAAGSWMLRAVDNRSQYPVVRPLMVQ
jgi:hypothetical protein